MLSSTSHKYISIRKLISISVSEAIVLIRAPAPFFLWCLFLPFVLINIDIDGLLLIDGIVEIGGKGNDGLLLETTDSYGDEDGIEEDQRPRWRWDVINLAGSSPFN